jgi:hypothetical protein
MTDTLQALRADFDKLAQRVKQLETLAAEQRGVIRAGFEEMRGAFWGVAARFDGLESEVRSRLEHIDARLERIETLLQRANGGSIAPS